MTSFEGRQPHPPPLARLHSSHSDSRVVLRVVGGSMCPLSFYWAVRLPKFATVQAMSSFIRALLRV